MVLLRRLRLPFSDADSFQYGIGRIRSNPQARVVGETAAGRQRLAARMKSAWVDSDATKAVDHWAKRPASARSWRNASIQLACLAAIPRLSCTAAATPR